MKVGAPGSFGAQLKALREAAGFTQEELATIAGLSVHAVSALERGERRRAHVETVRALSAALDLTGPARDALMASARAPVHAPAVAEALGLADVTALDLPKRARVACENHPTLMVLDNFEHVLAAAPLIGELLSSVPSLRSLVTSRAPLRVRGEREYVIGPLAL